MDWVQCIGETSQMLVRMLQGAALLGEASGHGAHLLVMKPGEWGSASAQASSSSSACSAPIKTRYQINVLYCRGVTGVTASCEHNVQEPDSAELPDVYSTCHGCSHPVLHAELKWPPCATHLSQHPGGNGGGLPSHWLLKSEMKGSSSQDFAAHLVQRGRGDRRRCGAAGEQRVRRVWPPVERQVGRLARGYDSALHRHACRKTLRSVALVFVVTGHKQQQDGGEVAHHSRARVETLKRVSMNIREIQVTCKGAAGDGVGVAQRCAAAPEREARVCLPPQGARRKAGGAAHAGGDGAAKGVHRCLGAQHYQQVRQLTAHLRHSMGSLGWRELSCVHALFWQ